MSDVWRPISGPSLPEWPRNQARTDRGAPPACRPQEHRPTGTSAPGVTLAREAQQASGVPEADTTPVMTAPLVRQQQQQQSGAAEPAAPSAAAQQHGVLTPGRTPLQAQPLQADATLITSSVRKRKAGVVPEGEPRPGRPLQSPTLIRRQGSGAAPPTHHHLALPEEAVAAEESEAEDLFSPSFHLGHAGGAHEGAGGCSQGADENTAARGQAAAAPPRPPALHALPPHAVETSSTDMSSGTSVAAEVDAECEVRVVACASATASAQASPCALALAPAAVADPDADADAEEEDEEEECYEFDPFLFIKRLPPLAACVPTRTTFLLPRQTRRSKNRTLVLDLDETLVHSTLEPGGMPAGGGVGSGVPRPACRADFHFPVEVGGTRHLVSVRLRPHLQPFLERCAALFEVVVFTASQRVYAEQLLDVVDPGRRLIRHRAYREACVLWEGNYLKDLTALGRDLARTAIVDNSPQAFGFQIDNGIPIESWYDDDDDEELLRLLPFLEVLATADDVRPHIEARFGLRRLVASAPGAPLAAGKRL